MTENFVIPKNASKYEMYKTGLIKRLMDIGLLSINRAVYFRYYEVYLAYLQTNNKTESVKLAADECGVAEMTIWRAISYAED